jgi:hypothetical protein
MLLLLLLLLLTVLVGMISIGIVVVYNIERTSPTNIAAYAGAACATDADAAGALLLILRAGLMVVWRVNM